MEWQHVSGPVWNAVGVAIHTTYWGQPFFYVGPNGGPGGYVWYPWVGVCANDPPASLITDESVIQWVKEMCRPFMAEFETVERRMRGDE